MQIFSNTQEGILQYRSSTTRSVNTVMLLLLVDHQVGLGTSPQPSGSKLEAYFPFCRFSITQEYHPA